MADYLFVYGTLLKGETHNTILKGCILTKYLSIPGILYNTGKGFPAAFLNINTQYRIYGELYRLPQNNESILSKLDEYEDIPAGKFNRIKIKINGYESYIYSINSPGDFTDSNIIKTGSWLKFSRYIKKDPLNFVLNFEKSHKLCYRRLGRDSIITLSGNHGIIISSPHATNHIRLNRFKIFERYTAAIAVLLHSLADVSSIYTNNVSIADPNYYDNCEYKNYLNELSRQNNQKFLLDIHGTGEKKEFDIYPGVGRDMEFLLGRKEILDDLYSTAAKYGINCGGLNRFPASRQQTVTKYTASRLGIPAMQLEINKKYRDPEKQPDKFLNLIEFLSEFLEKIKKKE